MIISMTKEIDEQQLIDKMQGGFFLGIKGNINNSK